MAFIKNGDPEKIINIYDAETININKKEVNKKLEETIKEISANEKKAEKN